MIKFTKKKAYIILFTVIVVITAIIICVLAGKQREKVESRQTGSLTAQTKNLKEGAGEQNSKAETQTESEVPTKPETQSQTEPESQTEPQTQAQTEPEVQTEPQTQPQTEPAAQTEPQTQPQTEPQSEPQTLYVPKIKNTSEYLIAIDAGHQAQGNYEKEPIGPGASETKNKVAGGTSGIVSGTPEYELTLAVALKLKSVLLERGYQVLMIRESNQVNISNAERAVMANNAGADVFIRIHADGADSAGANGMTALCQTPGNPYNGALYSYSRSLSDCLLEAMAVRTGARKRGVTETDTMSGINWSQVPVAIIEMGFMTNAEEDRLMSTEDYQNKLALGMADGIENYLAGLGQ